MSPLLVLLIIFLGGFVFSFVCAIIATCVESTGLALVLFLVLFGVTLYGISLIPSTHSVMARAVSLACVRVL